MRVIAGTYRSRRLQTLRGMAMRPTSDRTRETLFNILAPDVRDSIFVDLFAGSGAVGIEALSRGAQRAIFVEHFPAAVRLLRANLESLGIAVAGPKARSFAGVAEIIEAGAIEGLEQLAKRAAPVDIVFADPPYADAAAYAALLDWLGDSELLATGGRLIFEHSRRLALPVVAGRLQRTRAVRQGDTVLSFYAPVLAA
jgi:16S rRNA (guanine(966)-N(2))-methyltransferase RsmD